MAKAVLAVRLEPEDLAAFQASAKVRGHTVSVWARKLIQAQIAADRKSGKVK